MNTSGARRFVLGGSVVALAAAAAVTPFVWLRVEMLFVWAVAGWAAMVVIGLIGGAALVLSHGRPGNSFLLALSSGMLTRLIVAGAGALFAASTGAEAVGGYLTGIVTGFLPLMLFEVVYFARNADGGSRLAKGCSPDGDWLNVRR